MSWIVGKLKEGSTWAGIAGIVAGMSFIPHAQDVAQILPSLGVVVGGILAIWFP
jgi:hypothetical protein